MNAMHLPFQRRVGDRLRVRLAYQGLTAEKSAQPKLTKARERTCWNRRKEVREGK